MALLAPPCSRPALELLEQVGLGRVGVTAADARRATGRPKPTVDRHLAELVDAGLVWRVRRNVYVTPRAGTYAQLSVEPSSYLRSVVLYDDGLDQMWGSDGRWAFACLGVHQALDLVLPDAMPVVRPVGEPSAMPEPWPDAAFLYGFDAVDVQPHRLTLPSDAPAGSKAMVREVPALVPEVALALLAASTDPRAVQAVRRAAPVVGADADTVLRWARRLFPREPPVRVVRPNTVVFPGWLAAWARTARRLHAGHYLEGAADEPLEEPRTPPGWT